MNDLQTTQTVKPDEIQTDIDSDRFDLAKAFKLRYKNGLSLREIADRLGCHHSTVDYRLKALTKLLPNAEEIEMYRQNKSELIEAAEYKILNKILDDETIKSASLNNAAYTYQTLYNAGRLESGKSTSNISVVEVQATIADLQKQADELRKQL